MSNNRTKIAGLTLSAAALVVLIASESYTDRAIIPTKNDRPTVGFGSTFRDDGTPVQLGDTITPTKAIKRTFEHIQKSESKLKQCVTGELSQVEYDLLIDFAYQYGEAVTCKSSMVKSINQGQYVQSCHAYTDYKYLTSSTPTAGWTPYKFNAEGKPIKWHFDCSKTGNRVCAGIWKRQLERRDKCLAAQ